MYVNQIAINEAKNYLQALSKSLAGTTEGALVNCILASWRAVADKIDEALIRHGWHEATIIIKCRDVSDSIALFLAFRQRKSSEWRIDPGRTRIAARGGFHYKWEIHIDKGNVTLIKNKPKILQVIIP